MERKILPFTAASPESTHPAPDAVHGAGTEAQRRSSLPWAIDYQHNPNAGRPDLIEPRTHRVVRAGLFAERLQIEPYRPSTYDRIANALGSKRLLDFYVGFYAGAMFTAGMALIWSKVWLS